MHTIVRQSSTPLLRIGPLVQRDGYTPITALSLEGVQRAVAVVMAYAPPPGVAPVQLDLTDDQLETLDSSSGVYGLRMTVGQTSIIGRVAIDIVDPASMLPWSIELRVISSEVFDALFLPFSVDNIAGMFGGLGLHAPVVCPILASARAPTVADQVVRVVKGSRAPLVTFTVLDQNDSPIDLSGKTVKLAVIRSVDDLVFQLSSGGDAPKLTILGDDNNIVVADYGTAIDAISAGLYRYELWDVTNDVLLTTGSWVIESSARSEIA